jgi:hypothetical protein
MVVPLVSSKYFGYSSISSNSAPVNWASGSPPSAPVSWANSSSTSSTNSVSSTFGSSSRGYSSTSVTSSPVSSSSGYSSGGSYSSGISSKTGSYSSPTVSSTITTTSSSTSYPLGGYSSISTTAPVSWANGSPPTDTSTAKSTSSPVSNGNSSGPTGSINSGSNSGNSRPVYYSPPRQVAHSELGQPTGPIQAPPGMQTVASGQVMSGSDVVNSVLGQYGYQLLPGQDTLINNLQPGQSVTVSASAGSAGAAFKITYLGNGQYQIQSVGTFYNPYDFYHPQTSLNVTATAPTYDIYANGSVSVSSLLVSGTVTTHGTTNINEPYYNATYNINETVPINYMYNTQTGQLTFWGSNPQGGQTLQSISLPTLTFQQYIQLVNGQMPPGIKPGWYYYPTLNEFVQVSYQTVQQPQINWNALWYGYSYQPITNNQITTNTTNQQTQILQNSFFSPQLLSDAWNGITTLGQDVYNWFTGLFSSKKPIISSNNTLNLNYQQLANEVLYGSSNTNLSSQASTTSSGNTLQLNYQKLAQEVLYPQTTTITTSTNTQTTTNSSTTQQLQILQDSLLTPQLATEVLYGSSTSSTNYQIPTISSNSVTGISGSLYYQQLAQQINNNPYYPYNTSTVKIRNLVTNTMPTITDTTATYTQMNAMNTINQIKNVESGIRTYNIFADVSSLLGAKTMAQYYQTLAQQTQIYGSPSFYQADQLGQTERLIAATIAASMPLTIAGIGLDIAGVGAEVGAEEIGASILPRVTLSTALTRIGINAAINAGESVASGEIMSYALTGKPLSAQQALQLAIEGAITGGTAGVFSLFENSANIALASFGTQFTPLNFAKNLGLNIGGSLLIGNIYSYATTGEPLSLQQDIYSIEEAGPATLAYSSIAGILESPNIANSFLKLVTSPNSNKYWPITARVLYDTGTNALAMFGSSLTAQGFGNIIGAQQGINLEEAAEAALFAGGLTFGFEGFSAFRNPGEFVKSFGYYPIRESTIDTDTLRIIRKGQYKIGITGRGIVPEARPIIGNRIITEKDFANVKPIKYEFDIGGNIKVEKANGIVRIPLDKSGTIQFEKSLNEPGETYYSYKGIITTSTEKGSLFSNIEGIFKAQGISNIENTEDYMNLVNAEQEELEKTYSQFKELRNVPKKGIILSRNFLDNRLIPFVQNVNAGQDVLTASINTAEDIAGSRFVSLVTSSNYLANEGFISPNDIDRLLGTASKQYNYLISDLENIKQEAYNEISNNALSPETTRATNLKGIDNVIIPEDLKMKMGELPNPNFINRVNRVIYYINAENGEALPNTQYVTIPNVENPYGIESFGFSSPLYREINVNSNIQPITNRDLLILARLNNADFVRSVSNILDLMRNGAISPDEAQILLENEVRQYYNRVNYIKSLNQKIPSNVKPEDSIWQYLYGARPRNLDLYSNNLNLYNDFNKVYLIEDISKVKTSLGETYRTMGEGIIANSDSSGMGTIYQVMRNNNGKTWLSIQQSTTIPTSKDEYLTFSYQESIDPDTLMLKLFGKEIKGEPLNEKELQVISKYLGQLKVIGPPKGIIRPYTNYSFSIVGINQNAINVNNNYNIGMNRVPNVNRNQLETNIIQNQYTEHPELNEYNIQNELNIYRQKALENLRQDYLSSISTMYPLQNQYSRDTLYGLKNIVGLQNIEGQSIRGREKQVERLRARQKEMERQKFVNIEKTIVPQILIEEGLAVGLLLDKGITIKIRPRTPLPPPPKPKPKIPTPPTPPPKELIPFGFPEISIMGQPIRGLVPGFGRGVRSMYDIQYALSRLQW